MADNNGQTKKKKWYLRWWMFFLYIIIFIIFISSLGGDKQASNNKTADSQNQQKEEQKVETLKVSAVQLSSDYDANKVAADAKYEGKVLEINGTIKDIGKDILGAPYVTLEGMPNKLFGVQCMFAKSNEQKLITLSKGKNITLTGKVSGELIGNVIVRECDF